MLNFMKLELRKHRFLFRGIVGAFYATILFSALMSLANRVPTLQFMALTALSWAGPGLLLMPLLYGATSGAALRGEPAASAEAGLPISPGRKVGGALAAMGLYLLGVAVIFWVTALLLSPALDGGGTRAGFASALASVDREGLGVLFIVLGLFWLVLAVMLLASFTIAYHARHAMLGGLVGGLLSTLMFAAVGGGIWLRTRLLYGRSGPIDWRNYLDAALIPLVGVIGMLAALRLLARWGERREKPGLVGWGVIELGTLLGVAAAALWLGAQYRAMSRSLEFAEPHYSWKYLGVDAANRYALLKTPDGALVSIDEQGGRALLLEALHQHPLDLVKNLDKNFYLEVMWDSDSTLWALTRGTPFKDDGYFELWHGTPGARLKSHSYFRVDPTLKFQGLSRGPDGAGLRADRDHETLFARMPPPGKAPVFSLLPESVPEPALPVTTQEPKPAWDDRRLLQITDDGRGMVRSVPGLGEMVWRFPEDARAVGTFKEIRPRQLDGRRIFMVEVQLADGRHADAVCGFDGTVQLVWIRRAGATMLTSNKPAMVNLECRSALDCQLLIATEKGEFLQPVALGRDYLSGETLNLYYLEKIWSARSHVWLQYPNALYELNARDGRLVRETKLETGFLGRVESDVRQGNQDGYPFITGNRLYRIGYDGTVKSLGRARLD